MSNLLDSLWNGLARVPPVFYGSVIAALIAAAAAVHVARARHRTDLRLAEESHRRARELALEEELRTKRREDVKPILDYADRVIRHIGELHAALGWARAKIKPAPDLRQAIHTWLGIEKEAGTASGTDIQLLQAVELERAGRDLFHWVVLPEELMPEERKGTRSGAPSLEAYCDLVVGMCNTLHDCAEAAVFQTPEHRKTATQSLERSRARLLDLQKRAGYPSRK